MKRVEIKALFAEPERYTAEPVTVCGWVRTLRSSKALGFIELNDGSRSEEHTSELQSRE